MNVFDMIGPIMIGPSSSHTAGAARIGKIAKLIFGEKIIEAKIYFHGSFAKTYKGHGTDKAIIAGILGMEPFDPCIKNSMDIAKENHLNFSFDIVELDDAHVNTVIMNLLGCSGKSMDITGSSIGGGNIVITKIDEFEVSITGNSTTFLVFHKDIVGTIATVTKFMSERGLNIGNFNLSRHEKGETALMTIEVDNRDCHHLCDNITSLQNVERTIIINI